MRLRIHVHVSRQEEKLQHRSWEQVTFFLLYLAPNFYTASYLIFYLYFNYIVIADICSLKKR